MPKDMRARLQEKVKSGGNQQIALLWEEAVDLDEQVCDLFEAQRYGEAIPKGLEALACCQKIHGQAYEADKKVLVGNIHYMLANNYFHCERFGEAKKYADYALRNKASQEKGSFIMGEILCKELALLEKKAGAKKNQSKQSQEVDAAVKYFQAALQCTEGNIARSAANRLLYLGIKYRKREVLATKELQSYYETLDKKSKDYDRLRCDVATYYASVLKQPQEAIAVLKSESFHTVRNLAILGEIYNSDQHGVQDISAAIAYYEKALEQAKQEANTDSAEYIPDCHYNLAVLYDEHTESEREQALATHHYEQAVQLGHVLANHNLGYKYFHGEGIERDHEKAFGYFEKAQAAGENSTDYYLGLCYEGGYGVAADQKCAIEFFDRAYKKGYVDAGFKLARLRSQNKEYDQAITIWKKLITQTKRGTANYAIVMLELASLYDSGPDHLQNFEKADHYYQQAIQTKLVGAYFQYALFQYQWAEKQDNPQEKDELLSKAEALLRSDSRPSGLPAYFPETLHRLIQEERKDCTAQCQKLKEIRDHQHLMMAGHISQITHDSQTTPSKKIAEILSVIEHAQKTEQPAPLLCLTALHAMSDILKANGMSRSCLPGYYAQMVSLLTLVQTLLADMPLQSLASLISVFSYLYLNQAVECFCDFFNQLRQLVSGQLAAAQEGSTESLEGSVVLNIFNALTRINLDLTVEENRSFVLLLAGIVLRPTHQLSLDQVILLLHSFAILDAVARSVNQQPGLFYQQETIKSGISACIQQAGAAQPSDLKWPSSVRSGRIALTYYARRYSSMVGTFNAKWLAESIYCIGHTAGAQDKRMSRLQKNVLNVVKCCTSLSLQQEYALQGYEADIALFDSPDNIYLVEVDGPSHFCYGEKAEKVCYLPKETLRTYLILLVAQGISRVPYYQWDRLPDLPAKQSYITKKLPASFLKMPPAVATDVSFSTTSCCASSP